MAKNFYIFELNPNLQISVNPRQTEAFALGEKYKVQDRMFMEVAKVASIKIDVK